MSMKQRATKRLTRLAARAASQLLARLPASDGRLYYACRDYVDRHRNENNSDIHTNGEYWLMSQQLPKCDVVFDVGANIGNWTALALNVKPTLQVHCFEPSLPAYQNLVNRGFPSGVKCNRLGLSSVQGERTLFVFEEGHGNNSLYRRYGLEDGWQLPPQDKQEVVQMDTLEHYCEEHDVAHIDFLKLDVEGHDLEVLKGATTLLNDGRIKMIQFEYGGCNIDSRVLLRDFFEFMAPYSTTFYKLYPDRLQRVERYDQRLENFQYQNWVIALNV